MHCERTALAKSESEDKHDFVRGSIARSIIGRDSGFKYTSTWLTIGSSLDLDPLVVVIDFLCVVDFFLVVFLEKKDDNFLLALNISIPLFAVPVNFIFCSNAFTDSDENIISNILFDFPTLTEAVPFPFPFPFQLLLHTISFIF